MSSKGGDVCFAFFAVDVIVDFLLKLPSVNFTVDMRKASILGF